MEHCIKKSVMLLALTGLITLCCCDKDDENSPPKDVAGLLMTGTWKLTAYTINPGLDTDGDGIEETDLFENFPNCKKDDFYTFINNYIVEINNGPTKCDPADPQIWEWIWDLSADEERMMYDGNEYTIEELNTTTFRIKREEYRAETGKTHAIELTYQH